MVFIQDFIGSLHRDRTWSLSILDISWMRFFTSCSLKKNFIWWWRSYLVFLSFSFSFDFISLKYCSTGFSHGEYVALKRINAFIFLMVSNIYGVLWMRALSRSNKTFLPPSSLSFRILARVWYIKFSKRAPSTPPSMIWFEMILSSLIAEIKLIE